MSSFLENPNVWMYMPPWISQWNSCRTIHIPKGWCHQSFAFIMTANVSKSGRPSNGHRTKKGQPLSLFPRRVVPKNMLTIRQLPNGTHLDSMDSINKWDSFPMLVRSCLKSCVLDFGIMWTKNFQMSKLGLKKAEETRDQIANIRWTTEKAREFQINIYLCFINYAKAFDCVDHDKLWKILKEMGIPDHLTCLRNMYTGQEATVRTRHGATDSLRSTSRLYIVILLI